MRSFPALALMAVTLLWPQHSRADRADRETLRQAFHRAGISLTLAEPQVELLDEIIDTIVERHVDARDGHVLTGKVAAAIAAKNQPLDQAVLAGLAELTHSLDPHTAYLPPSEWNDMQVSVSGKFSGVGMELALKNKAVMVVSPIDGSPAAQAGIRTDERVLAVDGDSVDGLTLGQVVARIRGPVGTDVRLRLRNPAGVERDLTITRDVIRLQPVKGRLEGDIGYVRIGQFSGGVAALLRSQVLELDRQSAFGLKGLVLDLRRNPGGVLDEAVKMADLFLGDVTIVSTKARNPADNDNRQGRQGEIVAGTPMVVLIDGGSASAAEIVAGALKDQGRATLVGQKSYGKGSVQVLEEVSQGGVRVTIARYFRPNKQPVDGIGITPDIEVTPAENSDPQLERALEVVRKR